MKRRGYGHPPAPRRAASLLDRIYGGLPSCGVCPRPVSGAEPRYGLCSACYAKAANRRGFYDGQAAEIIEQIRREQGEG